jgi:hypothetical protein
LLIPKWVIFPNCKCTHHFAWGPPNDFRLLNWCFQYNKNDIIIIIIIIILGWLRQQKQASKQTPWMQISCFNYTHP